MKEKLDIAYGRMKYTVGELVKDWSNADTSTKVLITTLATFLAFWSAGAGLLLSALVMAIYYNMEIKDNG